MNECFNKENAKERKTISDGGEFTILISKLTANYCTLSVRCQALVILRALNTLRTQGVPRALNTKQL